MLKDWLRGSSESKTETEKKQPASRMVVAAETLQDEEQIKQERRRTAAEKKLSELVENGSPRPRKMTSYDSLFEPAQDLLLSGHAHEVFDGVQVKLSRHAQNAMVSSKWMLGKPNASEWELNVQMNGFTDIIAASWSTSNRYQLMYQNVSPTGALFVGQAFSQTKGPSVQGSIFAMLQYPWAFGGCSQVQYLKGQNFTLSHTQRLLRGVHFGSNLVISSAAPDNNAVLSHAISVATPRKDVVFMGEVIPSKGEWKVAAVAKDWAMNTRGVAELSYKESEEGRKASMLKFGLQRSFVGGANITTALINFASVNIDAVLPFGVGLQGASQFKFQVKCNYDLHTGGLKHGLVFTA